RHGRAQPRCGQRPGGAVRRGQAVRHRPGGRPRGHGRVPADEVRLVPVVGTVRGRRALGRARTGERRTGVNGQNRWGGPQIDFGRLEEMFDDWVTTMRENRPHGSVWAQATRADRADRADRAAPREGAASGRGEAILVDEYRDGGVHVVRVALPGIDPDQDVELTAEDGELRITVNERTDDGR